MKGMKMAVAVILAAVLLAACSAAGNEGGAGTSPADSPSGVAARPGSDATGDPSVNLEDRQEVSGVVKEVNGDLVLIELSDGSGEFMLRFSENSAWAKDVSRDIAADNTVTCIVKLEPTFAPPSQGEVLEVLSNEAAG